MREWSQPRGLIPTRELLAMVTSNINNCVELLSCPVSTSSSDLWQQDFNSIRLFILWIKKARPTFDSPEKKPWLRLIRSNLAKFADLHLCSSEEVFCLPTLFLKAEWILFQSIWCVHFPKWTFPHFRAPLRGFMLPTTVMLWWEIISSERWDTAKQLRVGTTEVKASWPIFSHWKWGYKE